MLSANCTEALSIQATVTSSGSGAELIKMALPLSRSLSPRRLRQCWYIKRGERVRVRGHTPFYAICDIRVCRKRCLQILAEVTFTSRSKYLPQNAILRYARLQICAASISDFCP